MLYWEITTICSEISTKHINANCGQNVTLLNAKPDGAKPIQLSKFGYIALHCNFVYNKLERSRTKHL
jgi:hypothetical protein